MQAIIILRDTTLLESPAGEGIIYTTQRVRKGFSEDMTPELTLERC